MAIYYIDPSASTNGSGTFESPYNTPPSFVASNSYLFKEGTIWTGRTSSLTPNAASLIIGVYDKLTGERVTDGSKWAIWDWRNSITSSAAVNFGANTQIGLDFQGIVVITGWWVVVNSIQYQCKLAHTAMSDNKPGEGASWDTYWKLCSEDFESISTDLADIPSWVDGATYSTNLAAIRQANPVTSPKFRHLHTIGGLTGFQVAGANQITPDIFNVISSSTVGDNPGILIGGGGVGAEMLNPSIISVSSLRSGLDGVKLRHIVGTGAGMIINDVSGYYNLNNGVLFQNVKGVHSINNISAHYNGKITGYGNGFAIDSLCADLTIDYVDCRYNADNGISGINDFSSSNPPSNIKIHHYITMFNGRADCTVTPATDGDGCSCHAGTGWIFDTGVSAYNLNSGHAHVNLSSGKVLNSVIVKNGYVSEGIESNRTRYAKGGNYFRDNSSWEYHNCITEDNLPFDFLLNSLSGGGDTTPTLNIDKNIIGARFSVDNGATTITASEFAALIASCTNVVIGDALLDPDDDFAPLAASAAIGAGKGIGIGLAGLDYNGNQRPAPSGDYNIGHREDYPPAKDGFGPWVHFDGTLPALTTESKFRLTRTVKSEGKPLTANQINKNVVEDL